MNKYQRDYLGHMCKHALRRHPDTDNFYMKEWRNGDDYFVLINPLVGDTERETNGKHIDRKWMQARYLETE